jgi:hypothetical protein
MDWKYQNLFLGIKNGISAFFPYFEKNKRVVRVSGYRSRGTGFDSRRYQIF